MAFVILHAPFLYCPENLGAAALLDKMELSSKLIPTIVQLGREHGAAA
jgi:hypothetical protein